VRSDTWSRAAIWAGLASGVRATAWATRWAADGRRRAVVRRGAGRAVVPAPAAGLGAVVSSGVDRRRPERVSTSTDSRNDTGAVIATRRAVKVGSALAMLAARVATTPTSTASRADSRPCRWWRLSSSSAATPTTISPSMANGRL
jgi:hypothetical protein